MDIPVLLTDAPIEEVPLRTFTEKAYLDYAMSVILDRALPHIGDGLKPVQRRIIYAMSELGLSATAKHKKSARTVGDVLGKYHPHGDSACYEAMVLMAQSFSYRYPLVDGQGHWGSIDDPKSFAAMRYTEARLSPFADVLLTEVGHGTVDWSPNFDGTLQEPAVLPARLPNVLLNGAMGIAVGMSTDIPPHALSEIGAACLYLLDHPNCSVDALCTFVPAPDYPGGAEIITPLEELRKLYHTGTGTVRLRAHAVYLPHNNQIVIDALPHQVPGTRILEQIAAQMRDKKLPMLEDLRDESDHAHPIRLVLVLRAPIPTDALMDHLFATTDLEKSHRVNLNLIGLDGRPQVKNLRQLLTEWLQYRMVTVRRRVAHRLAHVEQRLHLIAGFLIVDDHLPLVIDILRTEDQPKLPLMQRFSLSDRQVDALLEMKLRQLARLETGKLRAEHTALCAEQEQLQQYLQSDTHLTALIRAEITEDIQRYGDGRRCTLVERRPAQVLDETTLTPSEPMMVILSQKGWVRAAKGRIDAASLSYKVGDAFLDAASGQSHQLAVFLDTAGRSYTLPIAGLASARGYGEPLTGKLSPPDGACFVHVLVSNPQDLYLLTTDAGYGFICPFGELTSRNKAGKQVITVPEGAVLLPPIPLDDLTTACVIAISSGGRLLRFPLADLPQLAKGKGYKIIDLADEEAQRERLMLITCTAPDQGVVLTIGQRSVKLKGADLVYYSGARGRRGKSLPRGFRRVERITLLERG